MRSEFPALAGDIKKGCISKILLEIAEPVRPVNLRDADSPLPHRPRDGEKCRIFRLVSSDGADSADIPGNEPVVFSVACGTGECDNLRRSRTEFPGKEGD